MEKYEFIKTQAIAENDARDIIRLAKNTLTIIDYANGLQQENEELRKALMDAIDRPKGIVPDSAYKFYAEEMKF